MTNFPRWGFWVQKNDWYKRVNTTPTVHLFTSEKETKCGYVPTKDRGWFQYMCYEFSEVPEIGIYSVYCEINNIEKPTLKDFKKCKRCLKIEAKEGGRGLDDVSRF